MAALLLVTRPGPRKLAAGGDASASRGLVLPGHCGTPHWPLTKTTDPRDRKAVMLGRMNTAQQAQRSVAVGSMHDMTALLAGSTACRAPKGRGEGKLTCTCEAHAWCAGWYSTLRTVWRQRA